LNKGYEEFRAKAFSALKQLRKESAAFEDAEMLVGAADTSVSLKRNKIHKSIDIEWIEKIEHTIPYLDIIIRNPSIAIEDVDEILPVELSRHITEKSIKHLAQHTNLILEVNGDEVTPSKILNVYHDETYLTYENKFINTLLVRLGAFVDKRFRALVGGSGAENNYRFDYVSEFEHTPFEDGGKNSARVSLQIELTSPLNREATEADIEVNERYKAALERVERINRTLMSFSSSQFAQRMGKNYIRPPVIRTNAILKNKNMKECLALWEYIESFDKVGYSFIGDEYSEMPSDEFIGGLYSSVALQYTTFYKGVIEEEYARLLSEKHLFETAPEFDSDINEEELEDYYVYDSEYKKTVPVSRLMNNRKKLSEDEKRIRAAIVVALRADEIINEEILRKEAEERRLARERRLAEEEARRLAEEEARRLAEEEQQRRLAEEEERRRREEALRNPVQVRDRRSFMSRYIQSGDEIQGYYTEIKNALLSYKGVKSRTSWRCETFKRGRTPLAKIDVKGRTLYLYIAIPFAELENTKYNVTDNSAKRGGEEYPTLIKVKSERAKKHSLELIARLMESVGIPKLAEQSIDYRLPYEETDALIERGLIKVVLPKGTEIDENSVLVKAGFEDIIALRKQEENDTPPAIEDSLAEQSPIEKIEDVVTDMICEAPLCNADGDNKEEIHADIPDEPVFEDAPVHEVAIDEAVKEISEDDSLEKYLDEILDESTDLRKVVTLTAFGTPMVTRKKFSVAEAQDYVFADSKASAGAVLVPYTRAQYLALPRKKKKAVLTTVRKLIEYNEIRKLLVALLPRGKANPRIAERVALLEARLLQREKALPTATLWQESVKRVKNER